MVARVQQSTPISRPVDRFAIACMVAYAMLGWLFSGLGAILPELREELGDQASIYPLMPGAALGAIGLTSLWRGHTPTRAHRSAVWQGSVLLSGSIALMTITGIEVVSALGAVAAGFAAAGLIRVLPAALTTHQPRRSVSVMTRANAWSSLASIAAPLAVGGATAIGFGWRAGLIVIPALGAIWVVTLSRTATSATTTTTTTATTTATRRNESQPASGSGGHIQWIDAWLILCLSIVVEFAFVYFASTYLHEEIGMSKAAAASGTAAFAVGMASGRFLAGPIRTLGQLPLVAYLTTIAAGFALLWMLQSPVTAIIGLGVAGFGTAMLYPIGIDRLIQRFPGATEHGANRGALASGAALLLSPALLGALRAVSDVRTAYLSVPVLLLVIALIDWRGHPVSHLSEEDHVAGRRR